MGTSNCALASLPARAVDYIFTDPPFGENIYYSDLNFLVESWHGVVTRSDSEAIVDRVKRKGVREYGRRTVRPTLERCSAGWGWAPQPGPPYMGKGAGVRIIERAVDQ